MHIRTLLCVALALAYAGAFALPAGSAAPSLCSLLSIALPLSSPLTTPPVDGLERPLNLEALRGPLQAACPRMLATTSADAPGPSSVHFRTGRALLTPASPNYPTATFFPAVFAPQLGDCIVDIGIDVAISAAGPGPWIQQRLERFQVFIEWNCTAQVSLTPTLSVTEATDCSWSGLLSLSLPPGLPLEAARVQLRTWAASKPAGSGGWSGS